MKKSSALQYALVILGIILGYQAFQGLMIILVAITSWIINGNTYFGLGIREVLVATCFTLASWLLIMRSHSIAGYITRNASLNEGLTLTAKATSLLQIILIAIGVYFLLTSLPSLLSNLLDGLRAKNNILVERRQQIVSNRILYIIQPILAILLVALSKPLATFLANHIADDTISLLDDTDNNHPNSRNRQPL